MELRDVDSNEELNKIFVDNTLKYTKLNASGTKIFTINIENARHTINV